MKRSAGGSAAADQPLVSSDEETPFVQVGVAGLKQPAGNDLTTADSCGRSPDRATFGRPKVHARWTWRDKSPRARPADRSVSNYTRPPPPLANSAGLRPRDLARTAAVAGNRTIRGTSPRDLMPSHEGPSPRSEKPNDPRGEPAGLATSKDGSISSQSGTRSAGTTGAFPAFRSGRGFRRPSWGPNPGRRRGCGRGGRRRWLGGRG